MIITEIASLLPGHGTSHGAVYAYGALTGRNRPAGKLTKPGTTTAAAPQLPPVPPAAAAAAVSKIYCTVVHVPGRPITENVHEEDVNLL